MAPLGQPFPVPFKFDVFAIQSTIVTDALPLVVHVHALVMAHLYANPRVPQPARYPGAYR